VASHSTSSTSAGWLWDPFAGRRVRSGGVTPGASRRVVTRKPVCPCIRCSGRTARPSRCQPRTRDSQAFGSALRIHPAGWAQLYLRDPAGNLVEVDWHDVSSLSAETLAEASELGGQQGEAATATLFTA